MPQCPPEQALRESEARLAGIIDSAMDAIISVDAQQRVVLFNAAAEKMFGFTSDEMIGQTLDRLIPQAYRHAHRAYIAAFGTSEVSARAMVSQRPLKAIRASGEEFPIEASSISQINVGQQKIFTVIVRDVTARHQAEKRLQLANIVFNHAREGILITDAEATIVEVNDTFTHITGYSREEVIGRNPRMFQSGRHGAEFYATMWRELGTAGYWAGEVWNRHKNGEIYVLHESITAVRNADGVLQNYVTLFTDITPIKAHQQQLEHVAHYDALTGLPNRALLAERLQQAMARNRRRNQLMAVVCLDVDGFKLINDKHGRNVGDALLIDLTLRMKAVMRNGDTLARTGGDEFVAVLSGLKQWQDCDLVLNRLLQTVSEPIVVGDVALQVSASVGVTMYPNDAVDADLLIRHADQAMYVAKQAGKNRYHVFDVHEDVAVQTRRDQIEQIRKALRNHEFVLFYQPKVNMRTGDVFGAEALIRWQHPERGLLAPGAFLPAIEDHEVSIELGEWVIDTALRQMSEWHAKGLDIGVSVNIGALQLQQGNFASRLAELLAARPDIRPCCLELEVLETSGLEDIAQVSAAMRACQAMGVRFALDDFGTGYSSLTYLRRLPADTLKIDRSFVHDMLTDPDDLAIVESVIGLATAFRRQVIAEGVETVSHGEQLLMLGCKFAQGFGIARPMPAGDMPAWAASWQPDPAWADYADAHMSVVQ